MDEITAKRDELLACVGDFHVAHDHTDLTEHPGVLKEWLDKLFTLRTELQLLEDTEIIRRTTHTFSVKVDKGSLSGPVEKQ